MPAQSEYVLLTHIGPEKLAVAIALVTEFLHAHQDACTRGCPLLTEEGLWYLEQFVISPRQYPTINENLRLDFPFPENRDLLPFWNSETRQLCLFGQVLKEFRQPAPNQTTLLAVFQEQDWAVRVDDPLPLLAGEGHEEAKRRLHETLKNLNRGLPAGTIRWSARCRNRRSRSSNVAA